VIKKKHLYKHYKKELNDKSSFLIGQKAFIVNSKGKVLILKRHAKSTKSQMWDFPGGRLNFTESLRGGLLREVKEEVGLDIIIISLPLSIVCFLRDIDRNTQITRIIYLCSASGKLILSKEHSDSKWINPINHNKYKFIGEDYHTAFENYLKFKPQIKEYLGEGILQDSINHKNS